jgi:hypothetical protein
MELRVKLPSNFIELNPKQLRFVSWLFRIGYSEADFLTHAALFFSGLRLLSFKDPEPDGARWFKHDSLEKPFLLEPEIVAQMAGKCKFLLDPGEIKPIPWIRMAKARHYRLYNASFDEYLMAENYYFAYTMTKDPVHIDNLISVLYRRPWHRWNATRIQKRARIFQDVDFGVKYTVFMWYAGFRNYLPRRCPALYSGEKSSGAFNPRDYINSIIHQLSNGDITIKKTLLRQPALDALDELEQRAVAFNLVTKK